MRIGIIGCGLIGRKRAEAASGHEIVIVADLIAERAEALAKKFSAQATIYWQEVIDADVDIVIIAATHDLLVPLTIAAVEADKYVLVEKPAGRFGAEVETALLAATRKNRLVKVGFNHRFHPAVLRAHEIATSGALGPLMYIRGRYGHGGRVGYEKEWRCVPEISGGGELIDQGAHLIDLSRWFLGDLSLAFAATPTYFWKIPVDDNCFLALKGAQGEIAWLHATWTEWKNMFSFEVSGRYGKLSIDGLGGSYGLERLTYYKMSQQMGPPETTSWEYPFPDRSWELEFADFVDAIKTGRRPCGDLLDAYEMHKLMDAAYVRKP